MYFDRLKFENIMCYSTNNNIHRITKAFKKYIPLQITQYNYY